MGGITSMKKTVQYIGIGGLVIFVGIAFLIFMLTHQSTNINISSNNSSIQDSIKLRAVDKAFNITERTEYDLLYNTVYVTITENLGKNQIINISNIFSDNKLTNKIVYSELKMNQSYSIPIYDLTNISLGKYAKTNATIINATLTSHYYDSSDKEMRCDYVLGDKSCMVTQNAQIGNNTKWGYMPVPNQKEKMVVNGISLTFKNGGIPIVKDGTIQLAYKYKHPIATKENQPTALQNKYDILVFSQDGNYTGVLDPTWWNASWNYKIPINISENTGNNWANYSVLLTIPYNAHMNADFSDLRFLDSTEAIPLAYYIESKVDSTSANVWVKTPLTASANKTIYMYYNNPTAATTSNRTDSFLWEDDGSADRTSAYKLSAAAAFTWSGGIYSFKCNSPYNGNCFAFPNVYDSAEGNVSVSSELTDSGTNYVSGIDNRYQNTNNVSGYRVQKLATTSRGRKDDADIITQSIGWANGVYMNVTLSTFGTTINLTTSNISTIANSQVTDATYSKGYPAFYNYNDGTSLFRNLRAREFARPEPSYLIGSEMINSAPAAPTITFISQNPVDLTTTNIANTSIVIQFNISTDNPIDLTKTNLFWLTNGSSHANFTWIINGSYGNTGFNSNGITISNLSNTFNFTLGDNIYPANYLLNLSNYENSVHTAFPLTKDNTLIKALVLNMSITSANNYLEFMVQNITSTTASLRIYYCNSTYTSGNIDTSNSCGLIFNMLANQTFNHIENQSFHWLAPLTINTSSGTIGLVKITNPGYFLWRGRTGGYNAYYVPTIARVSATQTSGNTGVGWSDVSGTLDYHLHQFDDNDVFNYYVCSNYTINGIYNCSTTRLDYLNASLSPPTPPIVLSPVNATYNVSILINYTSAITTPNVTLSYYKIDLMNADDTFNSTILANNSLNLSYLWNSSSIITGSFNIHVIAYTTQNLSSFGESDVFSIFNPTQTTTSVSTSIPSPINYNTALTLNCVNNLGRPTQMYINGINETLNKGVSMIRSAGLYTINCSSDSSGDGLFIGSSQQITYIINQIASTNTISVAPSNSETFGTSTTVTGANCPSQLSCSLIENGIAVANPRVATLNAGTYLYNYTSNSNTNYTTVTANLTLTINKATPSLAISITPATIVVNSTSTTATGLGCPDSSCVLRRDGVIVANPEITTLGVGTYLYNYTFLGSTNYNGASVIETLTVNPIVFAPNNGTIIFTSNNLSQSLGFQVPYPYVTRAYMNLSGLGSSLGQCYQESTNVTNQTGIDGNCELNYTGTYQFSDVNDWNNPIFITDGDWDTDILIGANKLGYIFINYTKPLTASSATIEVKQRTLGTRNFTIPNDCFNNGKDHINIILEAQRNSGAGYFNENISCANSTDTIYGHVLNNDSLVGANRDFYEEAIIWNITSYPTNVNISINGNQFYYYPGVFTQSNNRTSNFADIVNQYLQSCTYIGNYCIVPITFNSTTPGILNYSDVIIDNKGILDRGVTYTSPVLEGATNTIIGNFSLGVNPTIVTLNYNGINYTPSIMQTGYNYLLTSNVTAPLISSSSNISFYYSFVLEGITYNSAIRNQSVLFTSLSGNCSAGGYLFLNISNSDEQSLLSMTGTVEYTLQLVNSNNQITYLNGTSTGTNLAFCSNENLTNSFLGYNLQLRYYTTNYAYKTYNIQNSLIGNLPLTIYLYYLNNSVGTQFKINYVDFNYLKYPGALIQIQRQYLEDDLYNTVEIPRINDDGQALGTFNTNNIRYKLVVINNGVILDTFENQFPSCQNIILGTCELNLRGSQTTPQTTTDDFTYTLSKTNSSLILTYIIPSGTPRNIQFVTNQNSRFLANVSNCNNSVFSSGGTITCDYNATIGDSLIDVQILNSDGSHLYGSIQISEDLSGSFLLNNWFISFILLITLGLMFAPSAVLLSISAVIGLVFLGLIFLIKGAGVFTVGASITWLVLAVVIAIYKIAKKEERT